ncbi:hypothetical protein KZ813_06990 [Sphingomonas sp. RHCKR7]|uniref:hypothetical protein n=1 Tax=Sphingomonas folli TaxID=2862497 RepID=UPI001CA5D28C|nr:hypothetical protein [Sphingomonas folli]MBW6526581.1 hypothetical protein [Sphingomonas folli]
MASVGSWLMSSAFLLSLSGCAINAMRLEGANQVSLASNSVVTQSNAALTNMAQRREQASRTVRASDPSCPATDEIYVFIPTRPPRPGEGTPPLCASGKDEKVDGYRTVLIYFSNTSAERLKPTILMLAAIAEYGEGYKKILDEPKVDVGAILASAAQKAADAKALTDTIVPGVLLTPPSLESKQAKSAVALLNFLVGLAQEARNAKKVADHHEKRATEINGILDDLKTQLADWTTATTSGYSQMETEALRSAYANERAKLSFEGRRAFLETIHRSKLEQDGVDRTAGLLSEAIDELKGANDNLGLLLDGTLSPEQRAQEAKLNEERIFKALKLTAEAATSWGVI